MFRYVRWAIPVLFALAPLTAQAQDCPPPVVSYYPAPPPTVAYYPAPAPVYSYYAAPLPAVSYYSAPTTAYYAAAPVSVTTYRFGLFRRRSITTVNYGPAVAVPAPAVSSFYYPASPVVSSYYGPVYRYP